MTAPLIAVDGLTRRFGSKLALDLDRLVVPAGTTALLGPNGAGKTTLLRALATVAPVPPSTVAIGGNDVADARLRVEVRRRLGYMAQGETLPGRMRVGDFCDYVAALKEIGPRRSRRRWTTWALAEVGLAGSERDRIASLSGGMQRRVMLAQALLGNPELLILDEPLVSLDAANRSAVVRSIAASADVRTTIVATHHSDELAAVCRTVIVLVDGRTAFTGPPRELAERARGQVWETRRAIAHPAVRALGPDRFRVVGARPPDGIAVEPTVHDGYLTLL